TNGARSSSSTSCRRSVGNRDIRSSNSSRTVAPSASTWRSPPTSGRSVGGILTRLNFNSSRAKQWDKLVPVKNAQHFSRNRLPRSGAELHVVDVIGDRRVLAADRARRIAADRDLVELGRERVEQEQPTDERVTDPEQE